MAKIDVLYHNVARNIIEHGYEYLTDNRPQPCVQLSSVNMDIPLTEFPLLTTKKMFTKSIVEELLWFLRGENNIKPLLDKKVNIWNQDAHKHYQREMIKRNGQGSLIEEQYIGQIEKLGKVIDHGFEYGDIGRNYGVQWRKWKNANFKIDGEDIRTLKLPFDQIQNLLDNLRKPNPINRRHIVTAWNPAELDQTALPPCHWAFEIIVRPLTNAMKIEYSGKDQEYLDTLWMEGFGKANNEEAKATFLEETKHIPSYGFILKWHQRSCDFFLGSPFNIASYALLAHIIGSLTDLQPLSIIGDLSNVHFYQPHIEVVQQQLNNDVNLYNGCYLSFSENYLMNMTLFKGSAITLDEFLETLSHEDFIFNNYNSFPALKGDMFAPVE